MRLRGDSASEQAVNSHAAEVILPTSGFCMVPWIWPGGMLTIRRCTVKDLCPGEIAVWFNGNTYLSHRVVRTFEHTFVTRGDFSRSDDPEGREHQLVGKATRFGLGPFGYRLDSLRLLKLGRLLSMSNMTLLSRATLARRLMNAATPFRRRSSS